MIGRSLLALLFVSFGISCFAGNGSRVYPACVKVLNQPLVAPARAPIETQPLSQLNGHHPVHPLLVARPEILVRLPETFPEQDRVDVVNVLKPTPELYLQAYDFGVFPWREIFPGEVTWHSPDQRGVLFFDEMKVGDTLRKFLMNNVEKFNSRYILSADRAFDSVIEEVQKMDRAGRPGQSQTWFQSTIAKTYKTMHRLGYAHSVEVWDRETGELVGGIIGTAPNGYFAGETMFHRKEVVDGQVVREVNEVGKMAGVGLVLLLKQNGFKWIDTQTIKPGTFQHQSHARYVSREEFLDLIRQGQSQPELQFKVPKGFFSIYFEKITPEEAATMNLPQMVGQPDKKRPMLIEVPGLPSDWSPSSAGKGGSAPTDDVQESP
jgi:leucyl/phenylalanyl-tRNA--protein transferase